MEEDQELLLEGRGLGAQVGDQEAQCVDQGVRVGDQEARDQGVGLALLKGGHVGEAQAEEGHPPTHLTDDQVHHPHQGHAVPPLRSWVIVVDEAGGHEHPATEVQGGGGRPLLRLGPNLCSPLKRGRRGRRKRADCWRGCAMTRARSCLPMI